MSLSLDESANKALYYRTMSRTSATDNFNAKYSANIVRARYFLSENYE